MAWGGKCRCWQLIADSLRKPMGLLLAEDLSLTLQPAHPGLQLGPPRTHTPSRGPRGPGGGPPHTCHLDSPSRRPSSRGRGCSALPAIWAPRLPNNSSPALAERSRREGSSKSQVPVAISALPPLPSSTASTPCGDLPPQSHAHMTQHRLC